MLAECRGSSSERRTLLMLIASDAAERTLSRLFARSRCRPGATLGAMLPRLEPVWVGANGPQRSSVGLPRMLADDGPVVVGEYPSFSSASAAKSTCAKKDSEGMPFGSACTAPALLVFEPLFCP